MTVHANLSNTLDDLHNAEWWIRQRMEPYVTPGEKEKLERLVKNAQRMLEYPVKEIE